MRNVFTFLTGALLLLGATRAQQPTWAVRYFTPTPNDIWQRTTDIVYGGNTNPWTLNWDVLKLDIYEPIGDLETARPVYLHVHGGAYWFGTKQNGEAEMLCKTFTNLGYVCVSIDYRLAPTADHRGMGPDTVAEDTKAAIRFMRKNAATYRIDTSRILIGGDSSGGTSSYITAYTNWEGTSGNPGYSSTPNAVLGICAFGYNPINDPRIPLILVWGTLDQVIAYSWAQWLSNQAIQNGVPTTLIGVDGAYHMPYYVFDQWKVQLWGTVYEHLRLAEKTGLSVKNEYSTTGKVTFSSTGWQGRTSAIVVSPTASNLQIPGLGLLVVDPLTSVLLWTGVHPQNSHGSTLSASFPLPPGLQGGHFYAQGFALEPSGWLTRMCNGAHITL